MTRLFAKMHGLGNSYIFMSEFDGPVQSPQSLAVAVSDRNRGIGSDGLITLGPGIDDTVHVSMRVYNADGSQAEMCGNGIRCACKFVYERGLCRSNPMVFSTPAGLRRVWFETDSQDLIHEVEVQMGVPVFGVDAVVTDHRYLEQQDNGLVRLVDPVSGHACQDLPLLYLVSVGNPHAVFFVEDLDAINMSAIGPRIESHAAFPERINVHAVQRSDQQRQKSAALSMVTWERGSGLTQACGTGAAGVCAVAVRYNDEPGNMKISLPGGLLALTWSGADREICLRGEAVEVCSGTISQDLEVAMDTPTMSSTHFA